MTPPRQTNEEKIKLENGDANSLFSIDRYHAKWTKVTTEDSPVIVYKDDGKLIGEITYIKIPLSLVEQLQSEAVEKVTKYYIEQIKTNMDEARADERKKIIALIRKDAQEFCKREEHDLNYYASELAKELEQPVEYCKCPSATYYEKGQICEDCGREGKVESKEERR